MRLIAAALGDRVGELPATAGPELLRQVAAIVKTHSAGVLASMARLACKAERLECIADIRDACEPRPSPDDEGWVRDAERVSGREGRSVRARL